MTQFKFKILFFTLLQFALAEARVLNVQIDKTIVPNGFDTHERAQFAVFGLLHNSCMQIGPTALKINPDTKTIEVQQQAYYLEGVLCEQISLPYYQIVNVGPLSGGSYRILDYSTGQKIGVFFIDREIKVLPTSESYAPLTHFEVVLPRNGAPYAVLMGKDLGDCWNFERVNIKYDDESIVLDPIVRYLQKNNCTVQNRTFTKNIPLKNGLKGIYLLHVRTLDGIGLNQVIYFE